MNLGINYSSLLTILVTVFLISFFSSFYTFKSLIKKVKEIEYSGKKDLGLIVPDLHKKEKPLIPKVGGLGVIAGLIIGIILSVGYMTFIVEETPLTLLAILTTILIIGLIAFVDDLIKISQLSRAFATAIAALPLIAIEIGSTAMAVPFLGIVEFGGLYYILVAVGVFGASNATNMLAGYNGLETGLALIIFTSLLALSLTRGAFTVSMVLASAIGAYLALLYFNIYPSRVIPGMSNYLIGAVIASVAIVGGLQKAAVMMFLLYFIEFLLKARKKFKNIWWGELTKEGKLKPASDKIETIPQVIMKLHGSASEKRLVAEIWLIQAVISISVLIFLW